MKRYLLLRDNRESGPYSLEQLSANGLRSLDLVWVDGESISWSYPQEIDTLRTLVAEQRTRPEPRNRPSSSHIFIALPPGQRSAERNAAPAPHAEEIDDEDILTPLPELRERTAGDERGPVWKKPIFPFAALLNVAVLFAGLAAGAFLIKKAVDGYSGNEMAMAEAPVAATSWADVTPVEKPAAVTPLPMVSAAVEKTPLKTVKPSDIRKQISIKTNKYNVGLFGGINGLELTVFNASPHLVDKIVVAVDYLKPNGDVVDSANYEVVSLRPNGSRTLSLPHSSRGVRVSYRILHIYSQQYKAAQKQA
jgi:hypothetical protein